MSDALLLFCNSNINCNIYNGTTNCNTAYVLGSADLTSKVRYGSERNVNNSSQSDQYGINSFCVTVQNLSSFAFVL